MSKFRLGLTRPCPLMDLAFRPLFFLGSLFSLIALLYWGATLSNAVSMDSTIPGYLWHAHEMLFGFVGAVLVGFLLTAVQNWTGLRSIHGTKLTCLTFLWLAGRIVMWPETYPVTAWLLVIIDLSFFVYAAWILGKLLYTKKQSRNYFSVAALLLLSLTNLSFHIAIQTNDLVTANKSLYGAVFFITLMMSVIGGRVIPMFTANTTQQAAKPRSFWLDRFCLLTLWIIAFIFFFQVQTHISALLLSILFFTAASLTGLRAVRWRFCSTLSHPLLWSLHAGYWFIAIGLALIGGHYAGLNITFSHGIHALTAGAMGVLILSMMSRVSLGHTGRPLKAFWSIKIAFMIILLAAAVRVVIIPITHSHFLLFLWLSILLWAVAYGIFIAKYARILLSK